MFEGYDLYIFNKTFTCQDDCFEFLYYLKWRNGYKCSKCGCKKSWKGRTRFHLRCSKCWYDESVTANTVFHKIKIPILKVFGITFRIAVAKKASSCLGISREYKVGPDSAWLLKRKAQDAVRQRFSGQPPRYHPNKEHALAKRATKANTKRPTDFDKLLDQTKQMLNCCLKEPANNVLPRTRKQMTGPPGGSKNINGNILTHNYKTWINGVHHHCSARFEDGYLAEYFFRHYYRHRLNEIWYRLMECFVNGKPYYYKAIER